MTKISDPAHIKIINKALDDYDHFPNNELPLLIYKGAFGTAVLASELEDIFAQNKWENAWRNGIYTYHHYHSVTHEVLGIYAGKATVQLGGPRGISTEANPGDVIVIPAGVSHKNLGSSADFACVGAYPEGMSYDMNYGKAGERPETDKNIANVDLPSFDPVYGAEGPLLEFWNAHKTTII